MGSNEKVKPKAWSHLSIAIIAFLLCISPFSFSSAQTSQDSIVVKNIVEGALHKTFYRNSFPHVINVAEIEWNRTEFQIKTVLGGGKVQG